MSESKDTYKTIFKPTEEVLFKDKGSKFFGYAYPVATEDDVRSRLDELKKTHYNARHWCYAWQLGKEYDRYRANDDGEPSNSAGMPIYGQIQSFDLTNILVVVVRYFGGTKLGVGGLIQAYKTTAQWALENARIIERTIDVQFLLVFDYPEMNSVMRIIKDRQLEIVEQTLEIEGRIKISVRKNDADMVFNAFQQLHKIEVKKLDE